LSFEFLSFAFLIIFKLWLTLFNLSLKGFVEVKGGYLATQRKLLNLLFVHYGIHFLIYLLSL